MSVAPKAEPSEVAALVTRGDGLDAVHAAAIAVVGEHSELVHAFGDPQAVFFARSALKPLQAIALVESGALERFGFGARELALACASHSGNDEQRAVVASMLEGLGLGADALQCGTEVPIGLRLRGEPALAGEASDPLRHNCSGKHAGFLALGAALAETATNYLDPEGAVQRAVRRALADAVELSSDALLVATDGCSAPNYALPLRHLAIGFKNLARADAPSALARIRDAMLAHPELVSGEGRLDHDLALAFAGRVVNKSGAEAVLAFGFREPPLGVAIKVLDGSPRALGPILVETLKQLGLTGDPSQLPTLARHERPRVENARKLVTGEIRASFRLR